MRKTTSLILAMMMGGSALPAAAQESPPPQPRAVADDRPVYETGGKRYETYEQCVAAKNRAKKRGTIAGAVVAAIWAKPRWSPAAAPWWAARSAAAARSAEGSAPEYQRRRGFLPAPFSSNSAASWSMIVPPSCSASMIVTARL